MELIKKFTNIFTQGPAVYIDAARVLTEYKKLKGHSRATQITMIDELGISDYLIIGRRGDISGKIIKVDIKTNRFKATMMIIYIDINQIKRNKELVNRIKDLPDVEQEEVEIQSDQSDQSQSDNDDQEDKTIETKPRVSKKVATRQLHCLKLADHEMFRDVNGNIFDIEIRGTRSKDGIRFKALDIQRYFEIERLVDCLIREYDSAYVIGEDYVILKSNLCTGSAKNTNEKRNGATSDTAFEEYESYEDITIADYTKDDVYLTLQGLLRVVFTSKSGNDNKLIMLDWIVGLVYTHKFGSFDERTKLAKKLTKDFSKHMLNKNISGIYYLDIGSFDELYDSMNIDKSIYPPETYGEYHIAKFGFASDIFKRVNTHRNTTDGYGRWSKSIDHKWSVMMSESQLSAAEKHLSDMIKLSEFKFDYTDAFGKKHTELIMVPLSKESKIREMYRKLLDLFPNKENDLLKELAAREDQYDAKESKIKLEYEKKINKMSSKLNEAQLIAKDHEVARIQAEHLAEVLNLKLQLAELKK